MKRTPEECAFSLCSEISVGGVDHLAHFGFSKQKNAFGSAFTQRANLPFFHLHPSFDPFCLIPIETKEITNGIDGKTTRKSDDAITSWIASLTFDLDITLTKNPHKTKDTHPDFEITIRTPRNRVIRIESA